MHQGYEKIADHFHCPEWADLSNGIEDGTLLNDFIEGMKPVLLGHQHLFTHFRSLTTEENQLHAEQKCIPNF